MLTPQEIQDKKFEKAVFGGYDMSQIDQFLDEIFNDYSSLYKENATLKAKMRVLVDKIEEYRSVDEEMRKALYVAQTSAKDIVSKAEKEAEQLLNDAHKDAEQKVVDMRREIEAEEARLQQARAACNQYAQQMKTMLRQNLQELDELFDAPAEEFAQPKREEPRMTVSEPTVTYRPTYDARVEAVLKELEENKTLEGKRVETKPQHEEEEPEQQEPVPSEAEEQKPVSGSGKMDTKFFEIELGDKGKREREEPKQTVPAIPEGDDDQSDTARIYGSDVFTPKPQFKFNDLQFGKNYKEDDE